MAVTNHKLPIYILHGWALGVQTQTKWQPLITLLQDQGYQVQYLPIPGLDQDLDRVWQFDDYVAWLTQTLKSQKKVILLGHSFGGQLAIRYARLKPQQVSKLILIANAGIIDRAFLVQLKKKIFYVLAKLGKVVVKGELFRKILYRLAREQDYYQASPLQRKTMVNVINTEIIEDLPQLQCQTLMIWGKQDRITPLKHAYLQQRLIPLNTLKVLEQARHSPQYTQPQEVASLINQFLHLDTAKA